MLFLSIHPLYAEAIVQGRKTVELRKRKPKVPVGSTVVIYSTTPKCEIVATAQLSKIEADTPEALWHNIVKKACVSREKYDQYFSGFELAVGLHLSSVQVLNKPVALADLRQVWDRFHPPQQYVYLNSGQQKFISELQTYPSFSAAITSNASEVRCNIVG